VVLLTSGSKLRIGNGLQDEIDEDDQNTEFWEQCRAELIAHAQKKLERRLSSAPSKAQRRGSTDYSAVSKASTLSEDSTVTPCEKSLDLQEVGLELDTLQKELLSSEELPRAHTGSSRYIQWMFLLYALINFISAIISPAMISILVTGGALGLGFAFGTSLAFGLGPPFLFCIWCLIYDHNKPGETNPHLPKQLFVAQLLAFCYVFIVAAIMAGIGRVMIMDPTMPGAIFLVCYASTFILAGFIHGKLESILSGIIYLFFAPTMYQILIIFAFFSFNDITWGTRGSNNQGEVAKDPILSFFTRWLEQPLINWLCRCYVPRRLRGGKEQEEEHHMKTEEQEQKEEKHSVAIEILPLNQSLNKTPTITNMKERSDLSIFYGRHSPSTSDHPEEEDIDKMKQTAEGEWSLYHNQNIAHIQKQKLYYQIDVLHSPEEQKALLIDLTKMKKNVLWVVLAANMAFYTLIVCLSSFSDFYVLQTNVFSLFLLFLFGTVQVVQTTCMALDGVKSLARRLSYM